jgi:hypothetical protein
VFTFQRIKAFTRSDVKIEALKGGSFVLFGGTINGKFLELVCTVKTTMFLAFLTLSLLTFLFSFELKQSITCAC